MATPEDLAIAETRVKQAVLRTLEQYLQLIQQRVFADPQHPDWTVWPSTGWDAIVADTLIPPVIAEFGRIYGAELGALPAEVAAASASFQAELQQVIDAAAIPQTVLTTVEEESDTAVLASLALFVAASAIWAGLVNATALTIAAVTTNAAVFAAAIAGSFAGAPNRLLKVWHAVMDDRTRLTHRRANGTAVAATEPFIVGGFPMRYPHDPLGPPQEVVNCRCVMSLRSTP